MGNLDAQFRDTFPGYSSSNSGYLTTTKNVADFARYDAGTLRAVGLQGQQLNSAQSVLAQLRLMSMGAGGQMQAAEVGNQIAEQQVEQTDVTSAVMLTDLQSKQAYQRSDSEGTGG